MDIDASDKKAEDIVKEVDEEFGDGEERQLLRLSDEL